MENALEIYQKARKKLNAFHYAMYLISWDSETEAPVGCLEESHPGKDSEAFALQ